MKLFSKVLRKEKRIFSVADFTETTNVIVNPCRGWYQLFRFSIEEEPDLKKVGSCLISSESLVLVMIDIGSVRNRELLEPELSRIEDILRYFREAGKEVILRICYDHEGRAIEREPSFFPQVLNHLKSLGPVLKEYEDIIFVYQGMLIGNWGEMHTSKFMESGQIDEMTEILKASKGNNTFLAVRRPVQWRTIHKKNSVDIMKTSGMGLFDDAIFGSVTDMGTFGQNPREMEGWNNPWTREDELQFESNLCRYVPNGGEVVMGEGYSGRISQSDILENLSRMHITYLNRLYDRTVLDNWQRQTCTEKGVWNGKSFYDYVGAHLGYRFFVKSVKASVSEINLDYINLEIEIENKGFANLYHEAELCIDVTDENGRQNTIVCREDMRRLNSGEIHKFNCMIKTGKGAVYLSARRKSDEKRIYFANVSDLSGRVLLGNVTVN